MNKIINFRNLLLARESRGLTQKKLCESINGLNQGNLSKIEKGIIPIASDILEQIANFLDYPINFFYKESQDRKLNSFFYRKRVTISSHEITTLEAKFDLCRMAIDDLLDSVDIPEFTLPSIRVNDLTPEEIANRIRIFLGLQNGPIENLVKIVEKCGIIIIMLKDVSSKFFGVTMFTNKMQPVIFINRSLSNDCKRFTIGHELGHLVMHLREDVYNRNDRDLDKEADRFSAEFNMPESDCIKDLIGLKYVNLPEIKFYWKLSKAAIAYRAKDLGLINESQHKYIMMQLSSSGQRKKEKESVELDSPTLLNRIIKVHIDDLGYLPDQLSELTGLSNYDIKDLLIYKDDDLRPKLHLLRKWA